MSWIASIASEIAEHGAVVRRDRDAADLPLGQPLLDARLDLLVGGSGRLLRVAADRRERGDREHQERCKRAPNMNVNTNRESRT